MSTSAKTLKAHLLRNLAGTAFLAFFGAVYELFSHDVYSYFMIYAFAIPLMLGVIPYTVLLIREKVPPETFLRLWSAAIATFSIGSAFKGVLEIYGTTNKLVCVYIAAGILLMGAALISARISRNRENNDQWQVVSDQ